MIWTASRWRDYELLDTSSGERLERWGKYILVRPDPQVIWNTPKKRPEWKRADGVYRRSSSGGGEWAVRRMPEDWQIRYGDLQFLIKPMGFKHTGLFPEQAANWDWIDEKIRGAGRPIKVLNLFAYTGGATAAAAKAGAAVCHVDASRGMVQHAKENLCLSGLESAPVRYIVDDCRKFIEREIRRGSRYDAVIMDPPSYGRGPGGEVWKLEDSVFPLVSLCTGVLTEKPLFFLLNSYTTGLSAAVMGYLLGAVMQERFGGRVTFGELGLPVSGTGMVLPAGAAARWEEN